MQAEATIKQDNAIERLSKSIVESTQSDDSQPIDLVIASLVAQLKKENENIAKLMERQRQLRVELLKAQEESLAALRRNEEDELECQ